MKPKFQFGDSVQFEIRSRLATGKVVAVDAYGPIPGWLYQVDEPGVGVWTNVREARLHVPGFLKRKTMIQRAQEFSPEQDASFMRAQRARREQSRQRRERSRDPLEQADLDMLETGDADV